MLAGQKWTSLPTAHSGSTEGGRQSLGYCGSKAVQEKQGDNLFQTTNALRKMMTRDFLNTCLYCAEEKSELQGRT